MNFQQAYDAAAEEAHEAEYQYTLNALRVYWLQARQSHPRQAEWFVKGKLKSVSNPLRNRLLTDLGIAP